MAVAQLSALFYGLVSAYALCVVVCAVKVNAQLANLSLVVSIHVVLVVIRLVCHQHVHLSVQLSVACNLLLACTLHVAVYLLVELVRCTY